MKVFEHIKKAQGVAVVEIAMGVFFAIMAVRLLGVLFGRQSMGSIFGAEDAENLENLGGRGRARRQAKRSSRRDTRAHNRDVKYRRAVKEGTRAGSSGRLQEDPEEPEQMPSDEEYEEMMEQSEYFESLSQNDIDNLDDAEYAEYLDYLEMVDDAEGN